MYKPKTKYLAFDKSKTGALQFQLLDEEPSNNNAVFLEDLNNRDVLISKLYNFLNFDGYNLVKVVIKANNSYAKAGKRKEDEYLKIYKDSLIMEEEFRLLIKNGFLSMQKSMITGFGKYKYMGK